MPPQTPVSLLSQLRPSTSIQRASIWIGVTVTILLTASASILPTLFGTADSWLGWAGNFSGGFMGAMVAIWIFRRAADDQTRATKEDSDSFRKAILVGLADFSLEFIGIASSVQAGQQQSFDGSILVDPAATLYKPTVLIVALDNLSRLPLESATTLLKVDRTLRQAMTHTVLPPYPDAAEKTRFDSETFTRLRYTYSNLAYYLSAAIQALDAEETYPRTKEQAKRHSDSLDHSERHVLPDLDTLMKINLPRRGAITDMRPIETVVGRDDD